MKTLLIFITSILTVSAFADQIKDTKTKSASCMLQVVGYEPQIQTQFVSRPEERAVIDIRHSSGYRCFGTLGIDENNNNEPTVYSVSFSIPSGDKMHSSGYRRSTYVRLEHRPPERLDSDEYEENYLCECEIK